MKAIFKFNGGLGALLCSKCNVIIKTGATMSQFEKDAMMGKQEMLPRYCEKCRTGVSYLLTRVEDGLQFTSYNIKWVKWRKDGRFQKLYVRPQVGFSCIVDPQLGPYYTWLTTSIQSMEVVSKNEMRFKTKNSTYILNKIKHGKEQSTTE
jgi:hypothetical protein